MATIGSANTPQRRTFSLEVLAKSQKRTLPGINIQWPISELILSGKKTIETRTYPIPDKYLNQDMYMIETPGSKGKFKARVVAIIRFTECFQYKDKEDFYLDMDKHSVSPDSPWAWSDEKPKWGWEVHVKEKIKIPKKLTKKNGIVFTLGVST